MTGKIWVCKVGEDMPKGSGPDAPMRKAIAKAYEEVTGVPPAFIFSGWGGKLTECERAVVENREPVEPFDEDEHNNEMDRLRARVAELEASERSAFLELAERNATISDLRAALAKREAVAVPEGVDWRVRFEALDALVNNPHTDDFLESVRLEAGHQQLRWGSSHDAGKDNSDWFWLIGYLAGKAINPQATADKRLHHVITTAAACLNWHAHLTGQRAGEATMAVRQPAMRPGLSEERQQAIDGNTTLAASQQAAKGDGT